MSDISPTGSSDADGGFPEIAINPLVADKAKFAFYIAFASFAGLLGLFFVLPAIGALFRIRTDFNVDLGSDVGPTLKLIGAYFPHLILFIITLVSVYIGFKLVVASGANPENPIPPANYRLLAPLIVDGKSESIDQYVRLSSLSGFTGTFTKLGLTGLPLTTVALTLIFAVFALLPITSDNQKNFMDLTKLTLGAFIGSFVQRQVEQRRTSVGGAGVAGTNRDQSKTPAASQ